MPWSWALVGARHGYERARDDLEDGVQEFTRGQLLHAARFARRRAAPNVSAAVEYSYLIGYVHGYRRTWHRPLHERTDPKA